MRCSLETGFQPCALPIWSPTAWRMTLDGTDPTPRPLLDEAWDSGGLGWLADGRAVAVFGPGACGRVLPQGPGIYAIGDGRSEEHTSELQSLMRISYAVFCLRTKTQDHRPEILLLT